MPTSLFFTDGCQFIDGVTQTLADAWLMDLGSAYLGGSKQFTRRDLLRFDVAGPAAEGRSLGPADVISSAQLLLEVIGVIGSGNWPASLERNPRQDWDYTTANWNRYKTGSNWTVAGGDTAPDPPSAPFTVPATTGPISVAGLGPFVTDALVSRGGRVLLRLKKDDESPGTSQWCTFRATQTYDTRPRLSVTYEASSPIAEPLAHTLGASAAASSGRAESVAQSASAAQPARTASPGRPR